MTSMSKTFCVIRPSVIMRMWFETKVEAVAYAKDMICRRINARPMRLLIIQTTKVVEIAPPLATVRGPQEGDETPLAED